MSDLSQKLDMVQLLQIASGYWWSQALYAATRLGVAEALAQAPRSAESVARELSVDRGALFRLLRALASQGLFARNGAGEFALTERGRLLLEDHPSSLRALVLSLGDLPYRAWGSLESSIRTGRPAFDDIYGCSYFDYLDSHPEHSAIFDGSMTSQARLTRESVAGAFDFSRFRSIVDVGGGRGVLLSAILERNPALKGYVLDRPAVFERAVGSNPRVERVVGDFFEGELPRCDLYLLSLVLHDWDDEACGRILRNVRRAIMEDRVSCWWSRSSPRTTIRSSPKCSTSICSLASEDPSAPRPNTALSSRRRGFASFACTAPSGPRASSPSWKRPPPELAPENTSLVCPDFMG
ncbi:MAG: methyltransferase [Vicinamibacteria bacterium]